MSTITRAFVGAAAGVILALSSTACATGDDVTGSSASEPPTSATPSPSEPAGPPAEVPTARWDAIVTDLDTRGVTAPPEVVSAGPVTWPDGSLGCPRPGMSYIQIIIEGMQVVVEADGKTYDYRFGDSDAPKLCEL